MGSDLACLGLDLACRLRGGCATDRGAATAIGTQSVRRSIGIALFDLDIFGRYAQFAGDDLCVGGLVALTLGDGPHAGNHTAGGMYADLGAVEHAHAEDVTALGRAGTDDLGKGGDADAHELAAGAFLLLLLAQSLVIHRLEHLVQGGLIVAAVIFPAKRGCVGELLLLDEVALANLGLVDAEFLGQHIDHAFDQVNGLGHPE